MLKGFKYIYIVYFFLLKLFKDLKILTQNFTAYYTTMRTGKEFIVPQVIVQLARLKEMELSAPE